MNNEEAIKKIDNYKARFVDMVRYTDGVSEMHEMEEALDTAINALSQEPCEDAVSRQAVIAYLKRTYNSGMGKKKSQEYNIDYVSKLPSVNPTRERGTCLNCAMNFGLMHCEEFNPHDIVCEYWESDGLDKDDYCSQWEKADKGGEDAK